VSRELERCRCEKDGRKALFLTMDDEGKPYGVGKLSWIAVIKKLARGLDPLYTQIR